jgi:hypothetical protein
LLFRAFDNVEHVRCNTIIELNSGNDLARCLRWGGGYEGESISKILEKITRAEVIMMDRWNVSIEASADRDEIPALHKVLKVPLPTSLPSINNCKHLLSPLISLGNAFGKRAASH